MASLLDPWVFKDISWLCALVERSRVAQGSSIHKDQGGVSWEVAAHGTVSCGMQSLLLHRS